MRAARRALLRFKLRRRRVGLLEVHPGERAGVLVIAAQVLSSHGLFTAI